MNFLYDKNTKNLFLFICFIFLNSPQLEATMISDKIQDEQDNNKRNVSSFNSLSFEAFLLSLNMNNQSTLNGINSSLTRQSTPPVLVEVSSKVITTIFRQLNFRETLSLARTKKTIFKFVTGYEFKDALMLYGFGNPPTSKPNVQCSDLSLSYELPIFRSFITLMDPTLMLQSGAKKKIPIIDRVPSYYLYSFVHYASSLPSEYWPHIKRTNFKVIDYMLYPSFSASELIDLAKNLKGSNVNTLILSSDIGFEGIIKFFDHLPNNLLESLGFVASQIQGKDLEKLAQFLKEKQIKNILLFHNGTHWHDIKLFAEYLRNTSVEAVIMRESWGDDKMQNFFNNNYSYIKWTFDK